MAPSAPNGQGDQPALQNGGFESLLNFRDVGATVNAAAGRKLVREGLLYRSARPDDATPADRRRLRDHFGVRTVVDLRTKTEHLNAAERRRAEDGGVSARLLARDVDAARTQARPGERAPEPLQIPGIRYRQVKLTGGRLERFLLSQLSWASYFWFVLLFVLGYRTQAIAVIGREVMLPRGLVGLGTDTLDNSGPEIAEGLRCLLPPSPSPFASASASASASPKDDAGATTGTGTGSSGDSGSADPLPALIHCTQGKDRTGILVALVLLILGNVPLDAIRHDYELTDPALRADKAEMEARLEEIRGIGLTDAFGSTAPGFVEHITGHLESRYGGLDKYLDGIGFGDEERRRLRERLVY